MRKMIRDKYYFKPLFEKYSTLWRMVPQFRTPEGRLNGIPYEGISRQLLELLTTFDRLGWSRSFRYDHLPRPILRINTGENYYSNLHPRIELLYREDEEYFDHMD
jgi:hypothetical protein